MIKIILFLFFCCTAYSQTMFKDDFIYSVRDSLEGTSGWDRGGLNIPYNEKAVSPDLIFQGYSGSAAGNSIIFSNKPDGTTLEQTSEYVPEGYYLGQNFPNHFNPQINIYFSLPESQHVRIVILNLMGVQITELINNALAAGTFKLSYDAKNMSPGVYLYRIETAKFTESKKMLLIK